ncbi:DUF7144 family membrane protein [Cellulomonas soli]|uniref:Membrane protein n=1 Tax=Cellulomonas soli TaxID=931535 RepID=A0A512PDQ7_9CELL|nr:hypothetical protein [Cellulomonas soli]NYI60000.1 vacuolar-type H+-ATPase subunit I/STV1 [Cellulomonas soli]GEP69347.1 membrane protein [Cellulomonas soli]
MTEKHRAPGAVVENTSWTTEPGPTAWVGWIAFAGAMMIMLGLFHAIQGLVALFRDEYFLVAPSGLAISIDYSQWGWIHLVLGIVVAGAGLALLVGQMWARVVAVLLAFLSALASVAFLAAYPIWSVLMIAVAILVIWAVMVHGREMRRVDV